MPRGKKTNAETTEQGNCSACGMTLIHATNAEGDAIEIYHNGNPVCVLCGSAMILTFLDVAKSLSEQTPPSDAQATAQS